MKIYIITSGDYSDYHIDAVFTDKVQAEVYAATHHCDHIEEYESDIPRFATNLKPKFHWEGAWSILSKFGLCSKLCFCGIERTYALGELDEIVVDDCRIRVRITTDTNVDEERAKKIIFDKFYQWFYERQTEKGEK